MFLRVIEDYGVYIGLEKEDLLRFNIKSKDDFAKDINRITDYTGRTLGEEVIDYIFEETHGILPIYNGEAVAYGIRVFTIDTRGYFGFFACTVDNIDYLEEGLDCIQEKVEQIVEEKYGGRDWSASYRMYRFKDLKLLDKNIKYLCFLQNQIHSYIYIIQHDFYLILSGKTESLQRFEEILGSDYKVCTKYTMDYLEEHGKKLFEGNDALRDYCLIMNGVKT